MRDRVETLLKEDLPIDKISKKLSIPVGTRYQK